MVYPLNNYTVSGQITVNWQASDPDGDRLFYDIYVQVSGSTEWVKLGSNLNAPDYRWDTTTVINGQYRFKIVASDELGLSTELISDYFTIYNSNNSNSQPTSFQTINTSTPGFSFESVLLLISLISILLLRKRRNY